MSPGGQVYVTDYVNERVAIFSASGDYVSEWGSLGSGIGQFNGPSGVAVDATGNVYVAEGGGNRFQVFTGAGVFLASYGEAGPGDGQFNGPWGIAVDALGYIYVSDCLQHRIQKFGFVPTTAKRASWGQVKATYRR